MVANPGEQEIDDHERETKRRIADLADELRADFERSREVMVEFAGTTQQILEENREQHLEWIKKDRENLKDHFKMALILPKEVRSTRSSEDSG